MKAYYGIHNIEQVTRICYYIGLGVGILGLGMILLIKVLHIPIWDALPGCVFYTVTGYYCPGCGGTRAVAALLKGRIFTSLYYHPFVLYMAVYYAAYEGSHTLSIMTNRKVRGFRFCPLYFYVGIGLIIVQWAVKNYLRMKFGFLL